MDRTPDNDRPNPIARAFSKLLGRGNVRKPPVPTRTPAVAKPGTPQAAGVQTPRSVPGGTAGAPPGTRNASGTPTQPAASSAANMPMGSPSQAAAPTPTASARTYTVVKGDSLSKIAQQVYGRADRWTLIFEANRGKITDPDLIRPGQVLVLPETSSLH